MAINNIIGSYKSVSESLRLDWSNGQPLKQDVYCTSSRLFPFISSDSYTFYFTSPLDPYCTTQGTNFWEQFCSPPLSHPPTPNYNYYTRVYDQTTGFNYYTYISASVDTPRKPSQFDVTRINHLGVFYYNKLRWIYDVSDGRGVYQYKIYRSVDGGPFTYISDEAREDGITGNTLQVDFDDGGISGLDINKSYEYYVCGVNQLGTGICSDTEGGDMFTAPSGLTSTGTTHNTIGVSWTNNDTGFDDITIKLYSGGTWSDFDTVADGTSSYIVTGLTDNTEYQIQVCSNIDTNEFCSNIITESTPLSPEAPTGLTQISNYFNTATIQWVNNGGVADYNEIMIFSGGTWNVVDTVNATATTYTYSGLTANNSYNIRVRSYTSGVYYHGDIITITTRIITAPTLNNVNVTSSQAFYSWTNNSTSEGIKVYYKESTSESWVELEDVVSGITTSYVLDLELETTYNFKVSCYYNPEFDSNIITETTGAFPQPFCQVVDQFTYTGATCGATNGQVEITNKDYMLLYDFVLRNPVGNYYYFDTDPDSATYGQSQGLYAGWYLLQVNLKPEYKDELDNDACDIPWIPIENTNSSVSLYNFKKQAAACGPFDIQEGRFSWKISGSSSTYSAYFFKDGDLGSIYYQDENFTDTTIVLGGLLEGCYRGIIVSDDDSCQALIDLTCVESLPISSIGGIRQLFVTPWSEDLDYNYWKTSDEDFFLESEDTSNFFSTKIKEYYSFSGGSLNWYKIPVMRTMSLEQKLTKVRQGIILKDTLNVDVPKGMIERFEHFNPPPEKWVYVIQDAMGQWWTGGYEVGATIEGYKFETGIRGGENKYSFRIEAVNADKILTALDEAWVNRFIFGEIPQTIDGLVAWYGSSVNNGETREDKTSAGDITQWDDISGNGNHATTTSDYFYYGDGGIKNDFAAQYFNVNLENENYPQGSTTMIVYESTSLSGFQYLLDNNGTEVKLRTDYNGGDNRFIMISSYGATYDAFATGFTMTDTNIFTWRVAGYTNTARVNGVDGTPTTYISTVTEDFNRLSPFTGILKEVIHYNRKLSESELQRLENYLISKYNL